MKCPLCQVDMIISKVRYVIDTSEEEPKLFLEQDMSCRNKQCTNYEKVVETVRDELPVG